MPALERNRNNTDIHSFDPNTVSNDDRIGQTTVEVAVIRMRLNVSDINPVCSY